MRRPSTKHDSHRTRQPTDRAEQPAAQARGGTTHRGLLDAAADELIARGGQMEIAAVAERAGVSVGLSYHYFGSKAGLLAAVVEDFYDRYDAAVIDLNPLPGGDWATRERRRLERQVDFLLGEPLAALILARLSAEPEVAAVEARRLSRHIDLGASNIAGAQKKGELPPEMDPRLRVAMIMGGLRQAMGQALAGSDAPDREHLTDELWSFVAMAAGLGSPGARTARPRIRTI